MQKAENSEALPQIRDSVCADMIDAVAFVKRHGYRGARVELVGHSSEEYEYPSECGMARKADEDLSAICRHCTAAERDKIAGLLHLAGPSGTVPADRYLCNLPLAARRAVWVQGVCLNWAREHPPAEGGPTLDDVIQTVTIAAEPSVRRPPAGCLDADCGRTVSVRLRLPVSGRPAGVPAAGG